MRKVTGILCLIMVLWTNVCWATEAVAENMADDAENVASSMEPPEPAAETQPAEEDFDDTEEELEDWDEDRDTIQSDVYRMGDEVTLEEDVDGNVYVMAKTLSIRNTTIAGNLYAMAENVEISNSDIDGSVYIMGQTIHFSSFADDLYLIGSKIYVEEDAYIFRDAKMAGDTIDFQASVDRNMYAVVDHFTIGDSAEIGGTLQYSSEKEAEIPASAQISDVQFSQEKWEEADKSKSIVAEKIWEALGIAFKTLLVALAMVLGRKRFQLIKRTESMGNDFVKYAGKGALFLICVPIVAVLLMITVLGVGFGMALMAFYIFILYIATSIAAVEIAGRILRNEESAKLSKVIGVAILSALVIWLIGLVPGLGGIVRMLAGLIGLGVCTEIVFPKKEKEEVHENETGSK